MGVHGNAWIYADIHGYTWMYMDKHGCKRITMYLQGQQWREMDLRGYIVTGVRLDIHGYVWNGYTWIYIDVQHIHGSTQTHGDTRHMDTHGYTRV